MQNTNEWIDLLVKFASVAKDVLLGGVGGIVAYMFDYTNTKDKKKIDIVWSNKTMFINCFIGAFVAYSFGSFIPHDMTGRDGFIGMIGVSSYAILGLVESKVAEYLVNKFFGEGK